MFACLQHASGVFWREWQIYGCFMLFYVPEASLFSADKQLEGGMWHFSVFVSFAHCMLHTSHSDFDRLMPSSDLRQKLTCVRTPNGFIVDIPASTLG